jgi:hypothetical protein
MDAETEAKLAKLRTQLEEIEGRKVDASPDQLISLVYPIASHTYLAIHLSFPKIQSGGIRAVRQNQRIIRGDVFDHPPTCNVHSRSVQVTTSA